MTPLLILGRDGMGADATETDFNAWVCFVSDYIDDECGFAIDVEPRGAREIQSDVVARAADSATIRAIWEAKQELWDRWCAGERADQSRPTTAASEPSRSPTFVRGDRVLDAA